MSRIKSRENRRLLQIYLYIFLHSELKKTREINQKFWFDFESENEFKPANEWAIYKRPVHHQL